MAAAHRSSSATAYGTRVNSTLTAPVGIVDGDILVIIQFLSDDVVPTPPTGFTLWADVDYVSNPADLWVWWKRASSESGAYTVSHAMADAQSYMCAVSGAVAAGTPQDPAPSTNQGHGTTVTATGVTTTVDGDLIIFAMTAWDDLGEMAPPTGSTPPFTERLDIGASTSVMYVADGVLSPAGATGDKSVTKVNSADNHWAAVLISVKAATGGGGGISIPVVTHHLRQQGMA